MQGFVAIRHPLGTLLLQEHMLKEKDVFQVEECCARAHCTFEAGILKLGLLTPEILSVFKHHLPLLAPGELLEIDPELLDLLDANLARKHLCIPVLRMGNTPILAMADPEDAEALRAIGAATGRNLDAVPALERDILGAIDYHYGPAGKAPDIEEDITLTGPATSENRMT